MLITINAISIRGRQINNKTGPFIIAPATKQKSSDKPSMIKSDKKSLAMLKIFIISPGLICLFPCTTYASKSDTNPASINVSINDQSPPSLRFEIITRHVATSVADNNAPKNATRRNFQSALFATLRLTRYLVKK